jgi:hypothetical protein
MIEWLGMERPGEGRGMLNYRWIYGGAAKGQNMNGDAESVHAQSGYIALANFVNEKAKIKTKPTAWTAEGAEKRWTHMKALYRKACFLPVPHEDGNDNYDEEKKVLEQNREKICVDFEKIFVILGQHPSTAPVHTLDSMKLKSTRNTAALEDSVEEDEDDDEDDDESDGADDRQDGEPEDRCKVSSSSGSKRSATTHELTEPKKTKDAPLSKQRLAEKKPFHLKKATSEPSHKRADIQTLFIKSQEDLAKNQQSQMRINAILELIKHGIPKEKITEYMKFMFGEHEEGVPTSIPHKTTTYLEDGESRVFYHTA